MRKSWKYLSVLLLLGIIVAVLLWRQPPSNSESGSDKNTRQRVSSRDAAPQSDPENVSPVKESLTREQLEQIERSRGQSKLERMKELIRRDYNTPISFWGKVVDQDGAPIAGVRAEIIVDEHAGNKKYVVVSDEKGLFELLGKRGARVRVKVSLAGYAPTMNEKIGSNISARTIYYAPNSKPMPAYAPPTKDNPQVFVLRKKNPVANLGHAMKRHVSVDTAGVAQIIDLKAGEKNIEVEVRCWSSSPVPFNFEKYDWRAEIKVLGGKLRPISEYDPITAPANDYQPSFTIDMPKDTKENWLRSSPNGTRDFWVRFDDGSYAKARIDVKTGRKHEVDVEVWYNLDGTNNFEQ